MRNLKTTPKRRIVHLDSSDPYNAKIRWDIPEHLPSLRVLGLVPAQLAQLRNRRNAKRLFTPQALSVLTVLLRPIRELLQAYGPDALHGTQALAFGTNSGRTTKELAEEAGMKSEKTWRVHFKALCAAGIAEEVAPARMPNAPRRHRAYFEGKTYFVRLTSIVALAACREAKLGNRTTWGRGRAATLPKELSRKAALQLKSERAKQCRTKPGHLRKNSAGKCSGLVLALPALEGLSGLSRNTKVDPTNRVAARKVGAQLQREGLVATSASGTEDSTFPARLIAKSRVTPAQLHGMIAQIKRDAPRGTQNYVGLLWARAVNLALGADYGQVAVARAKARLATARTERARRRLDEAQLIRSNAETAFAKAELNRCAAVHDDYVARLFSLFRQADNSIREQVLRIGRRNVFFAKALAFGLSPESGSEWFVPGLEVALVEVGLLNAKSSREADC